MVRYRIVKNIFEEGVSFKTFLERMEEIELMGTVRRFTENIIKLRLYNIS